MESDFAKYFPHFVFVLRDFSLQVTCGTSKEYLDSALNETGGGSEKAVKKD